MRLFHDINQWIDAITDKVDVEGKFEKEADNTSSDKNIKSTNPALLKKLVLEKLNLQ